MFIAYLVVFMMVAARATKKAIIHRAAKARGGFKLLEENNRMKTSKSTRLSSCCVKLNNR